MYNPAELTDTKGVNWGTIDVPGASHPVYQFGSGGERIISFELYVDGERGRFGRQQQRDTSSLSIADELVFYRSLVYPAQYGMDMANTFPYEVLFSFGQLYVQLPCIVKKADWKITYWSPQLEPVRAIISMTLGELTPRSQTQDDVLIVGAIIA